MAEEMDGTTRPLVRVGMEDVPILFANDFIIQFHGNEFILTVGQLQPPPLFGSEEERRQQISQIEFVPVKVVARLALTEQRMEQLVEALQSNLQKYREQRPPEGVQ